LAEPLSGYVVTVGEVDEVVSFLAVVIVNFPDKASQPPFAKLLSEIVSAALLEIDHDGVDLASRPKPDASDVDRSR